MVFHDRAVGGLSETSEGGWLVLGVAGLETGCDIGLLDCLETGLTGNCADCGVMALCGIVGKLSNSYIGLDRVEVLVSGTIRNLGRREHDGESRISLGFEAIKPVSSASDTVDDCEKPYKD